MYLCLQYYVNEISNKLLDFQKISLYWTSACAIKWLNPEYDGKTKSRKKQCFALKRDVYF